MARYLFINTTSGGSTGNICQDLIKSLEEKGGRGFLVAGYGTPSKNCFVINEKQPRKYINSLLTKIHGGDGFFNKHNTKIAIQEIKKFNPDIVCIHNLHGHYINIEMLFSFLKTIYVPIVFTLHDCFIFTGGCAYFSYHNCNYWYQDNCKNCPYKDSYPYSFFKRKSNKYYIRKKDAILSCQNRYFVTPSQWLNDLLTKTVFSSDPKYVINNGIDTDIFNVIKECPKNTKEKATILSCAAIWDKRKGVDCLNEVAKKYGNKYNFVCVGKKTRKQDLDSHISWIPFTSSKEELSQLYRAADAFFTPSREDNYPTVIMESIMCGTPVVAFDVGGTKEIISGKYGKIVSSDCSNFEEVMNEILSNSKYSGNCYQASKNTLFSKSNMVDKYCELFERILNEAN